MIKRNISLILVILAMTLNILSFDFSNFNIESKNTWIFLAASIIIIVSITALVINENKKKRIIDK
ncbi:hypothetical protein ALGA_3845 [Labilibaculum antarcticum]|uniref:Uncharacterized protein n=1 Tax=Labilibaculum antarcticum TaxID=1717717 RepID=A0A1Y1CNZ5_9BACT|nr:hypothetical protein ALGA_3845 [Labilibaculum antarcticum]